MEPRMRSSIACQKCRQSKVKCVNEGINTTCRACQTSGRTCTYPSPAIAGSGTRKKDILKAHPQPNGASPDVSRKRPKRPSALGNGQTIFGDSPRSELDALNPQLLTAKVWQELFDIFQRNFSAELPFLHKRRFLEPLSVSSDSKTGARPAASEILLLAFLALTSRYHAQLVEYHSSKSNPLVAAEFYANLARARIVGSSGEETGAPTLERTQALLMLGMHEWGMCESARVWNTIGNAIRSAQMLGLHVEEDLDDAPYSRSLAPGEEWSNDDAVNKEVSMLGLDPRRRESRASFNRDDAFLDQEIRRRTFWSCFIMDRYLSSGKHRPQMLNIRDVRTQLPSSDKAFKRGKKVQTQLMVDERGNVGGRAELENSRQETLGRDARGGTHARNGSDRGFPLASPDVKGQGTSTDDKGSREWGETEGVHSLFVRAVQLHSQILQWSCAGGRRQRGQAPPWEPRSDFYQFREQLLSFTRALPHDLTLTPDNTSAHISDPDSVSTSTTFVVLHSILLLCSVMLHREYIPFMPLRCAKGPQGPLDPPIFLPEKYDIPPGFWDDSARELFQSARNIVDLLRKCQEWNYPVETPMVGFALYTAAFTAVYAIEFEWMDVDRTICAKSYNNGESAALDIVDMTMSLIKDMSRRLVKARGWSVVIRKCDEYFQHFKQDYKRAIQNLSSSEAGAAHRAEGIHQLPLREGGPGGGLEIYKRLERILKDVAHDEDVEMKDIAEGEVGSIKNAPDEASDAGSTGIKSDGLIQRATPDSIGVRHDQWNPVNQRPDYRPTSSTNGDAHRPRLPTDSSQTMTAQPSPSSLAPYAQQPQPATPSYSHLPSPISGMYDNSRRDSSHQSYDRGPQLPPMQLQQYQTESGIQHSLPSQAHQMPLQHASGPWAGQHPQHSMIQDHYNRGFTGEDIYANSAGEDAVPYMIRMAEQGMQDSWGPQAVIPRLYLQDGYDHNEQTRYYSSVRGQV